MLRAIITMLLMSLALILLIPMLFIIFPVWLFVFLCVALHKRWISSATSWEHIVKYDPHIGWKPRPNLNKVYYLDHVGDRGSIITDQEGWPCKYNIEDSDIVVFGDSFAFGYGSEIENTYFGMNKEIRIKPISAAGYNMVQELLLMKQYRNRLKDKLVIWFICLENDLSENLRFENSRYYTSPFVRINNTNHSWEMVTSHLQPDKWLYGEIKSNNTLRFATICTPSAYSDRVFSACEYLIQQGKEICDSVGAEMLIFTIPDKKQLSKDGIMQFTNRLPPDSEFDPDFPDAKIKEICNRLNISFLSGKSHLNIEDYKINDSHWNKKGNKKVSGLLVDFYKTRKVIHKEVKENSKLPLSLQPTA